LSATYICPHCGVRRLLCYIEFHLYLPMATCLHTPVVSMSFVTTDFHFTYSLHWFQRFLACAYHILSLNSHLRLVSISSNSFFVTLSSTLLFLTYYVRSSSFLHIPLPCWLKDQYISQQLGNFTFWKVNVLKNLLSKSKCILTTLLPSTMHLRGVYMLLNTRGPNWSLGRSNIKFGPS
jgi:hypothetical protein